MTLRLRSMFRFIASPSPAIHPARPRARAPVHLDESLSRLRRARLRKRALMARTANALILTGCTLQQPYQAPQMAVATRWHAPMRTSATSVFWWIGGLALTTLRRRS